MRLISRINFSAGRKTLASDFNYEEVADAKWKNLTNYSKRYQSSQKFEHCDKLYQQFVYGHSCHLVGLTPNSFQSLKFAKSAMKYITPNLLILGGISDNYLRHYESVLGIHKHYDHPIFRPQKMQCKERLSRIIQTRLEEDSDFIWHQNKKEMASLNHKDKRIMPHQYLTAAHMASTSDLTRIVLGKPSDTLVIEDLIMRYEVSQLREIAQRAILKAKERQESETSWELSYTREAIQNYVMSEEPQIYSREITYQTALLKRYAKIYDKIMMMLPGYFTERVATQVHQVEVNPQRIFRDGLEDPNSQTFASFQRTLKSDPQTILQKFALLMLIRQSWIQKQFAHGTNVFRNMCFGQMFKDMDISELFTRYERAKQTTQGKWHDLMHHRINNIHVKPGAHIKMTLGQQFQILEERATKHFPYTYQEKNYLSDYEDSVKMAQLEHKMRQHLNEEGDKFRIQLFDKFTKGYRSKEGIILYSKLLGKMNVQMEDRLKLPVFHYGAFRGIYKQYLRDFLLRGEENSRIEEKIKKRQTKIEDMMQNHMKKMDDPLQLQQYISGKKGKVMHVNFDPETGPVLQPEDLQQMKNMYGNMSPQDQQELKEQYGEDWDQIIED